MEKRINLKLILASILLVLTIGAIFTMVTYSCSVGPKDKVVETQTPPPPPPPPPTCGDLKVGETKTTACNGGSIVQVCTDQGTLREASNTCNQCGKTGFADVQPLFTNYCVSCHVTPNPIDQLATAQSWAPEISRRVGLDINNRDHMPLNSSPKQLSTEQISLLQKWVSDGAQNVPDCGGTQTGFLDLDYIESAMVNDLNALPVTDRPFTRYLITAHKIDEGPSGLDNATMEKGINKTLNSVNPATQDIVKAVAIDPKKAVWRFDLRNFDIQAPEIAAIEAADNINIISNTTKGLVIQQLAQTKKPWFHADGFMNTVQRAGVYYKLLQIATTEAQFLKDIKVDFNGQLASLSALFIGGNQSPISILKNRLLVRVQGGVNQASYFWQTFDTNDQFVATKNLFSFPLLAATGGAENFNFDASEVIYSLPNGFQAYALFDNKGVRLDAAAINIVRDNVSPITPVIENANSCTRCHNAGMIPMQDQVLAHVTANGLAVANDIQLVQRLYHTANPNNAQFIADQRTFGKALTAIGVNPSDKDPITTATDQLLLDWNLNRAASFLFLTADQFTQAVNSSPATKAQIGQLLTGGTVPFQQFLAVEQQLIADARLFQDPLGQ